MTNAPDGPQQAVSSDAPLRRGWTTGACAAAATRAAYESLLLGECPAAVEVELPNGARPIFAVAMDERDDDSATAGIVKDAGDDPDVTHGALIKAKVSRGAPGSGVIFKAGAGVGMVTKPGLPIPPGEPAINPVPRAMIRSCVHRVVEQFGGSCDIVVEISIPQGEKLAQRTLNPRLGIVDGLSILGTTGIVIPFSCAAWIHSIYRGIDVARAMGIQHIAGSTGSTSEVAVQRLYALPESGLIEMGDFVGGMLKYLRQHPVPRVTIAGGFAKMSKLGQGLLDLHSKRGDVDLAWLAKLLEGADAPPHLCDFARSANTAQLVLERALAAQVPLGDLVAEAAWQNAANVLANGDVILDVVVFDRNGSLRGKARARTAHATGLPRNRR